MVTGGADDGGSTAGESGSRSISDASGVAVSIGASNMEAAVSVHNARWRGPGSVRSMGACVPRTYAIAQDEADADQHKVAVAT